jgi:predicted RNA-binding Zn ribbon-like protein
MVESVKTLKNLERVGNHPCLDFVNTVHSRVERDSHDYLQSYEDLVEWAVDGGLLSGRERRGLVDAARASPRLAAAALRRAVELREVLYRLFVALIRGGKPSSAEIDGFNEWLAQTLRHRRLVGSESGYAWSWEENNEWLDRPLWSVVLSAAEVLAVADPKRIRECPAPDGCGWIFYDTSKNGTRRWCTMRLCGNVAKARRYYRRHAKTRRENA